jgi:outer membrane murein-binding lipoprotein Lpp
MKTNTKMLLVAVISGIMFVATSASAHKCEFPQNNAECKSQTIKNSKCEKRMKKKDCEMKGGTVVKKHNNK